VLVGLARKVDAKAKSNGILCRTTPSKGASSKATTTLLHEYGVDD
jgi:hypothetical protein